jgi:hypothetical protein
MIKVLNKRKIKNLIEINGETLHVMHILINIFKEIQK